MQIDSFRAIRVLIADDHELVREGLKRILMTAEDIVVVGEARNGGEVLERVNDTDVDVVILDISMPGKNGLEVLKELKRERPHLPVLILSIHPEDRFATRALKAGAAGYITKDVAGEELVTALRKVVQMGKYVSPSLAEKLASNLETDLGAAPHELLSEREYQVLCMIGMGKTTKEIASELSLSVNTINTYRGRMLSKMKMTKEAELIRYALQHQLVE